MVATLSSPSEQKSTLTITWEKLPDDFVLEEEPVENTAQPLLAGALRESLELTGYIQPTMLIASNLGICATMNGHLVIKAPDWFFVKNIVPLVEESDRRSYTPNLQGEIPQVVMEFLSETEGPEYSARRTFPPGKWFFYEQILQVPNYVLFDPADGSLEVHTLKEGNYRLQASDENQRYWIAEMALFIGVWSGEKENRRGYWLRWWDEAGNLLPWAVEQLEHERQCTEQERQRAEQERQRAERLAEQLRALGIDPIE